MEEQGPKTALDRQISLPDNDVPLVTEAPEAEPIPSKAHEDVRRMVREEEEERRKRVFMIVGGLVCGLAVLTAIIVGITLAVLKEPGANARSVDLAESGGLICTPPTCHQNATLVNSTTSGCPECEVFLCICFTD